MVFSGAFIGKDRYCSPECLQAGLARTLSELLDRPRVTQVKRRHRIPLGLELVSRGELDSETLRKAVQEQKLNPETRLGQILIAMGAVNEEQVTSAVAAQWAVPVFKLDQSRVPSAAELVPFRLMQQFKMLPVFFAQAQNRLHVAFAQTVDHKILYSIEQMLGVSTAACLADESALMRMIAMAEQNDRQAEYFLKSSSETELVSMVTGYSARLGAEKISTAICDGCLWVRASARDKAATHFLFPVASLREVTVNPGHDLPLKV
jgi:type II secretion system (T2SS) protein E